MAAVRVFGLFGGALGLAWIAKLSFARTSRSAAPERLFGIGLPFFAVGYLDLGQTHNHMLAWLGTRALRTVQDVPNGCCPRRARARHPVAEALSAVVVAAALWGKRGNPPLWWRLPRAERDLPVPRLAFLRINEPALLGLTQPQLWALASLVTGVFLIVGAVQLNRP